MTTGRTPIYQQSKNSTGNVYNAVVGKTDENFNIIMRANFAQPIVKTEEDEFVIRLKEDF